MSTPTTATATLPHTYRHPAHYAFPQSYHPGSSTSYRSAAAAAASSPSSTSAVLSSSGRFPPAYPATPATAYAALSPSSTSSTHHRTVMPGSGIAVTTATSTATNNRPSRLDHSAADPSARNGSGYSIMPALAQHELSAQPARKRRRSREPDWNTFYKNGLPKEVIVIHDSPEADGVSVSSPSQTMTNGSTNGGQNRVANGTTARHLAKRRKADNTDGAHYDPVHNRIIGSHTNTPLQNGTPSGSTISSDRTNSAIHTTAATSLGSLSSNGQFDYEAQTGQKRKRTRQQIANEAKRRDVGLLGPAAYTSYRPPPLPPKKAGDVHVRVVPDTYGKGIRVDDDDGHYIVVPEAPLTDKYQTIKLLGQGTFGKVVQARDLRKNELVAIKIIRSVQKYRDASRIELRVLATLKANDEENRNRCIHLRDCFDYRGHICIVMDLLGQSVFDFLKGNNFVPFPNSQIQSFARQLFTSVAFLHDLNLIHTDLKPENILLADNTYQTFTYSRKIPSSSTTVSRQATQRRVLLDTEIRLIDFGSATFQDEYHSSVVSTRHYRAPEIILGLGWSFPCDIWSIGCILVEFFTGDALFQTHDNLEHLAMMEAVCDARIDTHLVAQVNKSTRNGGNPASKYFKRLKLDYPTTETTRASRRFVKAMKKLDEIIPTNNAFLRNFLDLLKKIFVYDPARRITAKQALQHPWFQETAHPDDGTEAAKIRMERMRTDPKHTASRGPPVRAS